MTKLIEIIQADKNFEPRLAYVIQFLNAHPLLPTNYTFELTPKATKRAHISLEYGTNTENSVKWSIPAQKLFFKADTPISNAQIVAFPYKTADNTILYSVEKEISNKVQSNFIDDKTFRFDLFETIFFHISRYEEYHADQRQKDGYNRMLATEMFLVHHNLHQQPVIDQLVFQFFKTLSLPVIQVPTKVGLTHDIDLLQKFPSFLKYLRAIARTLVKEKRPLQLFGLTKQYFSTCLGLQQDPFNTFDWLFRTESYTEKIVYFLSGGEVKNKEDFYDINSTPARRIINLAQERGYTVGIHPSLNTTENPTLLKEEKARLGAQVKGAIVQSRQHFLKWNYDKLPYYLIAEGIELDGTLGFNDRIGFRCGTGFAYHLYDFKNQCAFKLKSQPLAVMDVAWIRTVNKQFPKCKLSESEQIRAEEIMIQFLKMNHQNTAIYYNFHNSFFDAMHLNLKRMKGFYEHIICHDQTTISQ